MKIDKISLKKSKKRRQIQFVIKKNSLIKIKTWIKTIKRHMKSSLRKINFNTKLSMIESAF
jgi:hypothetical protein